MKNSYCIDGVFQIRNNSLQNSSLFEKNYVATQYHNETSVPMITMDSSTESWYNSNLTSIKLAELNSSNDCKLVKLSFLILQLCYSNFNVKNKKFKVNTFNKSTAVQTIFICSNMISRLLFFILFFLNTRSFKYL